ncbi:extracellular solute-binding protein [Pseudomonas sp. Fl4BN1]|uniref:extracellular solute-binding protein n=1 Tax=Pseudomonas sp. Fl4BN1 TaxID=2697651 RepID=UPI00137829D2|nr:extracellular solute-binding protein [Pseudomonas sp. Fl4BN1]NBF10020.1 extracellular solute-binding protein [Pseudomonas sp. Fl4BN1]
MTTIWKHHWLMLGTTALLSLPLPALASERQAVLYTTNNDSAVQAVLDSAGQLATPLKIGVVTGSSAALLKRIDAEGAATKADVFWSSQPNTLGAFTALYEPYRSPQSSAIDPQWHQPQQLWSASNIQVVVLMVNHKQLKGQPEPGTWRDLLDPAWKGRIIVGDPGATSTAYTVLWGLRQLLGAEDFKALAANLVVSRNSSAVLNSVAQGEYSIGLTFEGNAYAYVAGGQKEIRLIYPADGTFVTQEALTLVKNGPNPEAGRRLVDLLLARDTQIALLEQAYRRPSRSDIDVSAHVALPNLAQIKVFNVDEEQAVREREAFLEHWKDLPKGL